MAAIPIRYPRGRVTRKQELCLQQNKVFLLHEMECQDIVINLRSKFILNGDDNDFILGADGNRLPQGDQNSRLVDTITMRSPRGFEAFLQALKETGHDEAYRRLDQTLEGLPAGVETQHTRNNGSTADTSVRSDERDEVFGDAAGPSTSRSLSSESGCLDDVGRRLVERVQEAGEMIRQITMNLPLDSDNENPSRELEGSEQDFQDQLGSLCDRVDTVEIRLDGIEGVVNLKEITDEQQSEVVRLKEELVSAQAEIRRLLETVQNQENEINAQKEMNRQRSEQLESAEKRIVELLDHIQRLEKTNDDLKKALRAVQQKATQADSKIAALQKDLEQTKKQGEQAKKDNDAKFNLVFEKMMKLERDTQQKQQTDVPTVQRASPQPQRNTPDNRYYSPRGNTMVFKGLPNRSSSFSHK